MQKPLGFDTLLHWHHEATQLALTAIEYIRIYDGIKPPPPDDVRFTYAVPTIIDELTLAPMVYRDGEFVACEPLSEFEDYWFTSPTRRSRYSEVSWSMIPIQGSHVAFGE